MNIGLLGLGTIGTGAYELINTGCCRFPSERGDRERVEPAGVVEVLHRQRLDQVVPCGKGTHHEAAAEREQGHAKRRDPKLLDQGHVRALREQYGVVIGAGRSHHICPTIMP